MMTDFYSANTEAKIKKFRFVTRNVEYVRSEKADLWHVQGVRVSFSKFYALFCCVMK